MKQRTPKSIWIGAVVGMWWCMAIGWTAQAPPAKGPSEPPPGSGYSAGKLGEAVFQIDPQTGALIVLTDEETNQHIEQIIKQLDRPVPQVLIKVLFLEITHNDQLDLGVEASFRSGARTATDASGNQTTTWEDTLETIFGVALETEGGFYRLLRDDLDMTIGALAKVAKLEVLSRPSILARNNETAIITLGESVPFITNSRVTQDGQIINTVQYQDVGIILEVTPHITPEGIVEMTVAPQISTRSGETVTVSAGVAVPVIAKRAAQTACIVPDGMTIVIGGLMQDHETQEVHKVPILGDIPWAGTLFRRTIRSKTKTELLIFLTPHVVQRVTDLQTLATSESKKADLAAMAFTHDELKKHLEDYEKLLPKPDTKPKPAGSLQRTRKWLVEKGQIFK